jgi:glutaredoxin
MIVLYTTKTCPKCGIVKAKMDSKNIEYTIVDDELTLANKEYDLFPVLEVDGQVMKSMLEINTWINRQ